MENVMKVCYKLVPLFLLFGVMVGAIPSHAQDGVLVVEWADQDGFVIKNALRTAIAEDTERPDNRVYKLKRGGFYWNTERISWDGFHLRIVGETAEEADPAESFVCGPNFDEDCGPAIIQRTRRDDSSVDDKLFQNIGTDSDFTVENVWLMGQDNEGNKNVYESIQLDAADSRFTFNHVVFDRSDWHFLGPNAENCDMFVTNSSFRNIFGPSQQWEGLGVRFEVGADTVVFENNTFMNIGFTPFQSEAAPMNYFRANHNTFVNIGRSFQAGAIWKEAYVTNNVFVNYFWHGEQPSEYEDPDRIDPYTGFFGIAALPAQYGTDLDRRVVLANNSFWRDDGFGAMPAEIRAQPVVSDTTAGWFDAFDGMVMQNNFMGAQPDLVTYPADLIPSMIQHIADLRGGSSVATPYFYDPGRAEDDYVAIEDVWPLPEDFTYTTTELVSGGTDGLPLGNLNYFPTAKDDYLANQAEYVEAIEALAGARITLEIVGTAEADVGTLGGDASVVAVEGFTYYEMDGSGSIKWTFDLPAAGQHSLTLETNLRGNSDRGNRIWINDTQIKNTTTYGEYFWSTSRGYPADEWFTTIITVDSLVEGASALQEMPQGTNTIELTPSWGWQSFSTMTVVDAGGTTVATLTPDMAVAVGVRPVCDAEGFCPTGFRSVSMGTGGSVEWSLNFPTDGIYVARIFYDSESGGTARLLVDGSTAVDGISLAAGGSEVLTAQFAGTAGASTVTLESDAGGFSVDYMQLISVIGGGTASERNELPEGYALDQNYPNPFNPSTTISFAMGNAGDVRLTVYDVLGRQVATLVDDHMPAGTFHVAWNAGSTGALASGVYFYRLQTPVGQQVRSMVLLK
jgi:hypothetical protein